MTAAQIYFLATHCIYSLFDKIPQNIAENLHFLLRESHNQLHTLARFIRSEEPALAQKLIDRRGYSYNLKLRIHRGCITTLVEQADSKAEQRLLRCLELLASELDQCSELSLDSILLWQQLKKSGQLQAEQHADILQRLTQAIALIEPSLRQHNTQLALNLHEIHAQLDNDCEQLYASYRHALKQNNAHVKTLTNALFLVHNLQKMAECLLIMAESIISTNLGQPLKLSRFQILQKAIDELDEQPQFDQLQIKTVAETRSGSTISGVTTNDELLAIFKEGEKRKVKEERKGVNSWHQIYPGLAPKILSYQQRGQSAALLIEHLPGITFEQIVLHQSDRLYHTSLARLRDTLYDVWQQTHTAQSINAGFIQQLKKRLPAIYAIHPEFKQSEQQIGTLTRPSFDQLLSAAEQLERRFPAPFSVYIHGDFNLDNIIYDPEEQRINFIDLHRSRYMDYVQDVSVFMVSHYRLQVVDRVLRNRIMHNVHAFYQITRQFAQQQQDHSFDIRLALGLARSFVTSTRFILDSTLAKQMFYIGRYLIEDIIAHGKTPQTAYQLPLKEIFIA